MDGVDVCEWMELSLVDGVDAIANRAGLADEVDASGWSESRAGGSTGTESLA